MRPLLARHGWRCGVVFEGVVAQRNRQTVTLAWALGAIRVQARTPVSRSCGGAVVEVDLALWAARVVFADWKQTRK